MALRSLLPRAVRRSIVLVIDGDSEQRAMCAYALSGVGFDVMASANPDEARASGRRPDIILANITGNGGHDWALLGSLSADPQTHDIPVVAIADSTAPAVRARAERKRCAALCLRSCSPTELAMGLQAVLDRRPVARQRERRAWWDSA